jgi:hypothetical protein
VSRTTERKNLETKADYAEALRIGRRSVNAFEAVSDASEAQLSRRGFATAIAPILRVVQAPGHFQYPVWDASLQDGRAIKPRVRDEHPNFIKAVAAPISSARLFSLQKHPISPPETDPAGRFNRANKTRERS